MRSKSRRSFEPVERHLRPRHRIVLRHVPHGQRGRAIGVNIPKRSSPRFGSEKMAGLVRPNPTMTMGCGVVYVVVVIRVIVRWI